MNSICHFRQIAIAPAQHGVAAAAGSLCRRIIGDRFSPRHLSTKEVPTKTGSRDNCRVEKLEARYSI